MPNKNDALSFVSEQHNSKKGKKKPSRLRTTIGGVIADKLEGQSKAVIQKAGMAMTGHVTNSVEDIDMGIRAHQSNAILNAQVATGTKGLSEIGALKGANKVVGDINEGVRGFLSSANDAIRGNKKDKEEEQEVQEGENNAVENPETAEEAAQNPEASTPEETEEKEEKQEKQAKETQEDKPADDKDSEAQAGDTETQNAEAQADKAEASEKKVDKETKDGDGAGGGNAAPFGAGAPTVDGPKGAGTGKNSAEAFANSGASYQMTSYSGLGDKASQDLSNEVNEINASTPGVEGAPICDGTRDAEIAAHNSEMKAENAQTLDSLQYDDQMQTTIDESSAKEQASAQKSAVSRGSGENLPSKPTVEADTSGINACAEEASAKYSEAKSQAHEIAESANLDIEARGFDDMNAPKVTIEDSEGLETPAIPQADEIAQSSDEAKALFEKSDEGKQANAQIQAANAQIDAAEAERQAKVSKEIEDYKTETEDARAEATAEEQKLIAEQKAKTNAEIEKQEKEASARLDEYNAEQQNEINDANRRIADEKSKADKEINENYKSAEKDTKQIEEEGDKKKDEDAGIITRIGRGISSAVKSVASWVKSRIKARIDRLKNTICGVLDIFAGAVSLINKDLGDKLKRNFNKFKKSLDEFANKAFAYIEKAIDLVADAVSGLVEKLAKKLQEYADKLTAALGAIWDACKGIWKAILTGDWKAILEAIGDFFLAVLKAACAVVGIDGSFIDKIKPAAKKIIDHPGQFFMTLGKGVVLGFKEFGANIVTNIKAIFTNLFNLWLGAAGLKLPGEFSWPALVKFGLELIGIDVDGFLKKAGLKEMFDAYSKSHKIHTVLDDYTEAEDKAAKQRAEERAAERGEEPAPAAAPEKKDQTTLEKFMKSVEEKGIGAAVDIMQEQGLGRELVKEIMEAAIEAVAKEALTKGIAKLALMANPVGGIIAALKAVWDLIQFFRENASAIAGLCSAVVDCLAEAADGKEDAVGKAVEAALCQAIPLVIDLVIRLCGFNVGKAIKGVVEKIRKVVGNMFNKALGWVKNLFAGSGKQTAAAPAASNAQLPVPAQATATTQAGNEGSQGKAGAWANKQSERLEDMKIKQSGKVFRATGLTNAFKGKREGDLGVKLDNSKTMQAVDAYHENKRAHEEAEQIKRAAEQKAIEAGKDPKQCWQFMTDDEKNLVRADFARQKNPQPDNVFGAVAAFRNKQKEEKEQQKKDAETIKAYKAKKAKEGIKVTDEEAQQYLAMRRRVEANIAESKKARESSNIEKYFAAEKRFNEQLAIRRRVEANIAASKSAREKSRIEKLFAAEKQFNMNRSLKPEAIQPGSAPAAPVEEDARHQNLENKTSEKIKAIIASHHISIKEFSDLLAPERKLTKDEEALVLAIRKEIGTPTEGTEMTKVIPQDDISKYLSGAWDGTRGFVSVSEHSDGLSTLDEIYEGNRLDYTGTAFRPEAIDKATRRQREANLTAEQKKHKRHYGKNRVYAKINFKLETDDQVEAPIREPKADEGPFTGRGFTGSENVVLPELEFKKGASHKFVTGDRLTIIDAETGKPVSEYMFVHNIGWQKKELLQPTSEPKDERTRAKNEAKSEALLSTAQSKVEDAHFLSRHGAGTTLEQQQRRARNGKRPEGGKGKATDSSRFLTHQIELQCYAEAEKQRKEMLRNNDTRKTFVFEMDQVVGHGYLKKSTELVETKRVMAVFTDDGLLTMYPLLRDVPGNQSGDHNDEV